MLINNLKENIINKNISNDMIIFKCSDNDFIAFQYIDEIAKIKDLNIQYIDNINEIPDDNFNFFGSIENVIYIYKVDKLEDKIIHDNLYIICKSIDKSLMNYYNNYIVDIPKLENWQIEDYIKSIGIGIDEKDLDLLINILNKNIYKLDNELHKFTIFSEVERKYLFKDYLNTIINKNSSLTIFNLSNAIIKKDIDTIKEVYKCIDNIDIEPIGLLKVLYTNFRNILLIQLDRTANAQKLGMSDKQFYAIKYNINIYTREELINIFKFLCDIDRRIKTGDMPMNILIDYLIINIVKGG